MASELLLHSILIAVSTATALVIGWYFLLREKHAAAKEEVGKLDTKAHAKLAKLRSVSAAAVGKPVEHAAIGGTRECDCIAPGADGLSMLRCMATTKLMKDCMRLSALTRSEDVQRHKVLCKVVWGYLDDEPIHVATGCDDGQARVYSCQTHERVVSVRHDVGQRKPLTSVLLAPGPNLLTAAWDGKWHELDQNMQSTKPTEFIRGQPGIGHDNTVTGLAVNREGDFFACACSVGCVVVYRANCPTTQVEVTSQEELKKVHDALFLSKDHCDLRISCDSEIGGTWLSKDDSLLKEGGFAGKSTRKELLALPLPTQLQFRYYGCMTYGHRRAWRLLQHDAAVLCLVLRAEGKKEYIYSGSRDRTVRKWELVSGSCVYCYRGHTSMVRCLSVNGSYLATGSDDRSIRIWTKDTSAVQQQEDGLIRTLQGHTDFVRAVSLCSAFQERLVSAGDDHLVALWNVVTGEKLRNFPHAAILHGVHLHGSQLFTASADKFLRVWRTELATEAWKVKHPGEVTCLSIL